MGAPGAFVVRAARMRCHPRARNHPVAATGPRLVQAAARVSRVFLGVPVWLVARPRGGGEVREGCAKLGALGAQRSAATLNALG